MYYDNILKAMNEVINHVKNNIDNDNKQIATNIIKEIEEDRYTYYSDKFNSINWKENYVKKITEKYGLNK